MRILVTGGAGFVGSHLAKRLVAEGHDVLVVDDLSIGDRQNIPPEAEFFERNLSQPGSLDVISEGPIDAVCHLAAQSSGPASSEVPYRDLEANAASTLLLSRWCLERKVPRFLHASSMAVYGQPQVSHVAETATCEPLSYYGVSKLISEHFVRLAARDGLSVTTFRLFSVYGPGQNLSNLKQGMVSIFLAYMLRREPVPVTGSLARVRDFVYIDDVIDVWSRALMLRATPSAVYNIGSGRPTTVRELLAALRSATGLPDDHPALELPGSEADQFGLYADIGRIQADLDWRPRTGLTEGLRTMVAWARSMAGSRGSATRS